MILIDSSVWIDYFRGAATAETDRLDQLLGAELVLVGDIILAEVLQGFASERDFRQARQLFDAIDVIQIVDRNIALRSAQNFRTLRRQGITVRKTIDTLIATRCIESGLALLYSDRDFDPFVAHLGLVSAMDEPPSDAPGRG
ncbi:MAG: twitching motility protein PilT [Phenylobacterium sp. RIFCSPHIGHO2_01_FULL_70_10]|nr:MAG: twitching motility protein PilT [Phenylobacterium sp. RIFCSPHIGHO2_01_FULL_70_10]